jgi:hypothetical protein
MPRLGVCLQIKLESRLTDQCLLCPIVNSELGTFFFFESLFGLGSSKMIAFPGGIPILLGFSPMGVFLPDWLLELFDHI